MGWITILTFIILIVVGYVVLERQFTEVHTHLIEQCEHIDGGKLIFIECQEVWWHKGSECNNTGWLCEMANGTLKRINITFET